MAGYLTASKTMWEKSIRMAEKESGKVSFERAMAMYGLLNNTMASEDEDSFDEYVDPTIDLLKVILDEDATSGEVRAVLSSVYGLVMAYSPMKGMLYGSKSSSLMDDAIKAEPESALVQKLYAGSKLYTPSMWGGSPEVAVKAFEKSVAIYERDSSTSWLYLDALMGLAISYQKTEQIDKAKITLEKLLAIEPAHGWAKGTLKSLSQ